MIRHSDNTSESWKKLPWKQFRRDLFRLQQRVFKAIRDGDKRKATFLQRLILKSTAARMLAIRQVTQLNTGKRTAGIDGKASLSIEERFALNEKLRQSANNWKHSKVREISIPKKDGKTRILKVPTVYPYCTPIPESLGIFCLTPVFAYGKAFFGQSTKRATGKKRLC